MHWLATSTYRAFWSEASGLAELSRQPLVAAYRVMAVVHERQVGLGSSEFLGTPMEWMHSKWSCCIPPCGSRQRVCADRYRPPLGDFTVVLQRLRHWLHLCRVQHETLPGMACLEIRQDIPDT